MKKFIDKKLVLALLMSVSGLYAGIGATSMSYFRQGLSSVGKNVQQGLNAVGRNVYVGSVARSVGSSVKNHPYVSGIAAAVLAYEAGIRYFGLSNWTLSYSALFLLDKARKVRDKVGNLIWPESPVQVTASTPVVADSVQADVTTPAVASPVTIQQNITKTLPATPCRSATTVKNVPETSDKPVKKIKPSSTALCRSEVVVANQQELKDLVKGLSNGSVAISNDSEATFVPLCNGLLEEEDVTRLKRLFQCFNKSQPMGRGSYRASIIALLKKAVAQSSYVG